MKNTQHPKLTPRQATYIEGYMSPNSATFGNAYQSARLAGYSHQTARNLNHLKPEWLSENIGRIATEAISPSEIMSVLTNIIHDSSEPTIVRLKSLELAMKAYSMTAQHREAAPATVTLSVDLTSEK